MGHTLARPVTRPSRIGRVRRVGGQGLKLPATAALCDRLARASVAPAGDREISYRRCGPVGVLRFAFYNGAMSTGQCDRLAAALRVAAAQDTRVLVLRGGEVGEVFANGIHLHVIEAAANPEVEAWRNIQAIDDVCREIITCTGQLVVASVGGNAGAGGVMLALGADRVLARAGVMLNPHYRTMGLYGSEYWSYVLPRRVGAHRAESLVGRCEPVAVEEAVRIGLVDEALAGPPAAFEEAVLEYATRLATRADYASLLERKRAARAADERHRPLESYRTRGTGPRDRCSDSLASPANWSDRVSPRPVDSVWDRGCSSRARTTWLASTRWPILVGSVEAPITAIERGCSRLCTLRAGRARR